jgi:L-fucose mutarotase/ribose pyranase (RbsD/FucU family)
MLDVIARSAFSATKQSSVKREIASLAQYARSQRHDSVRERYPMLKGISPLISPELLKILMEMGHGDEIIIADGNFPSASVAQRLVRSDGNGCPELLEAILKLFPLDQYVEHPVALMAVVPGDPYQPVIWDEYRKMSRSLPISNMWNALPFTNAPVRPMRLWPAAKKPCMQTSSLKKGWSNKPCPKPNSSSPASATSSTPKRSRT